jgi:hypothetical protein
MCKVRESMMRNIFEDVESYMQARELLISFLLTGVFLFLSFVGRTRFSTIEVVDKWGELHMIHVSYYGFPFEMIAMLNPIGMMENYWANLGDLGSLARILWGGLFLNFVLYFLLAFVLVYLFRWLRGARAFSMSKQD